MWRCVTTFHARARCFSVSSFVGICTSLRPRPPVTDWVCRWKPCWVHIDDTFKKAYFEDLQFSKDGQNFFPSKMLHSHFLLLSTRQRYGDQITKTVPSSISNLWTPHQHRDPHGKRLENLMLLLGSSLELMILRPSGKIRRHHCLTQSACAILFTQSSPVPFLNVGNCRIPRKRSYQVMRKTFLSFETVSLRGWKRTSTLFWNDMWSIFERPSRIIAKHVSEGTTHLLNNIWAAACATAHPSNVEGRALSRNKLQGNGTLSSCKKQLRMLTASFSWIGSTWPVMEGVQCYSTRTPSSLMSKSNPFTFTMSGAYCLIKGMEGDSRCGFTGRAITCFFSSTTPQRPKNIHGLVVTR